MIRKEFFMEKSISSILNEASDVLHRIRVKLYPNRLPKGEGTYVARTESERVLSLQDVCDKMKTRGGFSGDHKMALDHVQRFFDEAVFQLCDGFTIDTGFFTLYPTIGGIFTSPKERRDRKKHPLDFNIRPGLKLKNVADLVEVVVIGMADTKGHIHCFTDVDTDTVNGAVSGGGMFIITGDKIKIAGKDQDCGVYFEPVDEPDTRIKVRECLAQNLPSKIIGKIPALTASKRYRVLVVTQYLGSGNTFLQKPKTLVSRFELLCNFKAVETL